MKNARMKNYNPIIFLFIISWACKNEEPEMGGIKFEKHPKPVWEGVWTAADPSVIRDGDTLRMYYSSLVVGTGEKLLIAGAKSVDGINWTPADEAVGKESIALDINTGSWDNHLEAVTVIRQGNETWMYYCGYPEEAEVAGTIVAESQIGLAISKDNINFNRTFNEPILSRGPTNTKDANALFSPTAIKEGNTYYLFYVAYCIENCKPAFIGILGASSTDGKNWTKLSKPIISGSDFGLEWAEVIKEPSIVKGPDNLYYLFISGDKSIGVARSTNILGPYEVYPNPILEINFDWEATSVIAPSVIIENNKVRMWYMGVVASGTGADFAIGYAESDFPFPW
jgi:beta-xylosidase